ncbi:MAG TPA: AI-2E family transporter [Stellaceae bacterium]|jgi:predicted PurR-regulated permease PerM
MSASDVPGPRDIGLPPDNGDGATQPSFAASGIGGAFTLVIAATVLFVARDIFVPLAIAALLTFVLTPPMLWLRHRGLGRALAAIAVVLLAFFVILGFGAIVVGEVASLTKEMPTYTPNLESKLRGFREAVPVDRLFQQGEQLIQDLRGELTPPPAMLPPDTKTNAGEAPVPVEIRQQTGILTLLDYIVGPVLKPLTQAGLILVFAIFFLLNREDLRDRFIRLAGARDLHRTTQMLNDAVEHLSRYLLMQCAVNAIYGTLIGVGGFVIGVPNAALWGVMSFVLRFLPYIGTWFAAMFPLGLALAVAPGWGTFIEMLGLFVVVEILATNVLEPWLFGASAGMSPVAVLVAATFWTWLWGPIGLVLSTPLTAFLVVIGRYAPPLRFLAVLLGNEAPLAIEESFYQRLLAGDDAEATEQAETFLKSGTLAEFCDQIAIPALTMAQEDSERGVLTRNARAEITETLREIVESLGEEIDELTDTDAMPTPAVECLGARNELDDAAAMLLVLLLAERGIAARVVPARHWMSEPRPGRTVVPETGSPRLICLSHLGAASAPRLRLLARRLRRRSAPDAKLLLGLWSGLPRSIDGQPETPDFIDETATSLSAAVDDLTGRLAIGATPPTTPAKAERATEARNAG